MAPSADERERLVDVADLVALELGDRARRADARGELADVAGAC